MTLQELEAELRRNVLRPVYLLLGPEAHLRRRAIELLKTSALPPDAIALNLAHLGAREHGMADVIAAANTFPMLSPRRLVLVDELEALEPAAGAQLAAYLESPQSRTVLVLIAAELDRRTTLFKVLAERATVIELDKLKGYALERWAEERIRKDGIKISSAALRKLVDLVGSELEVLSNEIDKLLIYCAGDKSIPDRAVDELVESSRQFGIFELTRALGRRDRAKALHLVGGLLEAGEHPLMIVTMLARHFRQVLIVQDLAGRGRPAPEIAAAAQIPGFLRDEFVAQARALDAGLARAAYLALADADLRFKSSGVDERMFLEKLIAAL